MGLGPGTAFQEGLGGGRAQAGVCALQGSRVSPQGSSGRDWAVLPSLLPESGEISLISLYIYFQLYFLARGLLVSDSCNIVYRRTELGGTERPVRKMRTRFTAASAFREASSHREGCYEVGFCSIWPILTRLLMKHQK